jgi:hypothetical protein
MVVGLGFMLHDCFISQCYDDHEPPSIEKE